MEKFEMALGAVRGLVTTLITALMTTIAVLASLDVMPSVVQAQDESTVAAGEEFSGGDRVARAPAAVATGRNAMSRKRYPGGADEDDLQVQETLPIPSRTYDGTIAPSAASDANESAEPPTND